MRLRTRYADEVATEAVKLPSFVKNIQPELQRMPREEALAAHERIPDARVRARWRKTATEGISADDLKPSIARLTEMVERIDRALQDAPRLAREEDSLADTDIAPCLCQREPACGLRRQPARGRLRSTPRVRGQAVTSRPTLCRVQTAIKPGKEIDSDPTCLIPDLRLAWQISTRGPLRCALAFALQNDSSLTLCVVAIKALALRPHATTYGFSRGSWVEPCLLQYGRPQAPS